MGIGHVMRTLALAQAWQDAGGTCAFAMIEPPAGIAGRLGHEGMRVVPLSALPGSDDDARQTVELAQKQSAAWVVVDGYQFGGNYQRLIKESGLRLLVLDDYGHADHYWADLVLNQNLRADDALYRSCEPYTRLLLGVRFALLRREFWKWRDWNRVIAPLGRHILITMGGADPGNMASKVMEAIQNTTLEDCHATVLATDSYSYFRELRDVVQRSRIPAKILTNVVDMPALAAEFDVAVICAGGTLWELLFMGCPTLSFVRDSVQSAIVDELDDCRVLVRLGWADRMDAVEFVKRLDNFCGSREDRARVSDSSRKTVDGFGVHRVLTCLNTPAPETTVALVPFTKDYVRRTFDWVCNAELQRSFLMRGEPTWEKHAAYFDRVLADTTQRVYAILAAGEHVGNCGFKNLMLPVGLGELWMYIGDRSVRGIGVGRATLANLLHEGFHAMHLETIYLHVADFNLPAIRLYRQAGFNEVAAAAGEWAECGCRVLRMELKRKDF